MKSTVKSRVGIVVALAAGALGLAACGSSTKTSPAVSPTTVAPATPTTQPISSGGASY